MKPGKSQIAIIGSGFGGIGLAIQLRKTGIEDFTIYERADDIGGVRRDNTYPGAACDVRSHFYSFSFEPNPDWSRVYSPQPEILAYFERCVEKYGVTPHLRLGQEVTAARFDEDRGLWILDIAGRAPVEPIPLTEHRRVYRRTDIHRRWSVLDGHPDRLPRPRRSGSRSCFRRGVRNGANQFLNFGGCFGFDSVRNLFEPLFFGFDCRLRFVGFFLRDVGAAAPDGKRADGDGE